MTRTSLVIKSSVSLQILAVILLQLYVFAPFVAQQLRAEGRVHGCSGDHRLCGCSPERIAGHTCCCYKSKKISETAKSQTARHHHTSDNDAEEGESDSDSGFFLSAAPCGTQPAFSAASSLDLKFLQQVLLQLIPPTSHDSRLSLQTEKLHGRSVEPPVPPPKRSIFS